MNGMIRFAHKLTFTRLVLVWMFRRRLGESAYSFASWRRKLLDLPECHSEMLTQFHWKMWICVTKHMLNRAIVLMPLLLAYHRINRLRRLAKEMPGFELLERQALAQR